VPVASHRWGQGATIEWFLPSRAGSPEARRVFGRFERMAVSPSAFLRIVRMIRQIDVRAVLPAIHVPTLVIQRLDDRMTPPCHGRYLASHITGARYFEQRGDHSLRFAGSGDSDALIDEIQDFLTSAPRPRDPDRVLAAILLAEAVDSPPAPAGQTPAGQTLAEADQTPASQRVRSYRGRLITSTPVSVLATFVAPGQAIRCAAALRDDAARGIQLRAGIHAGEVDLIGDDIAGASVHITHSITALAQPSEILVSRAVKDLVLGTGIVFTDRGVHELSGIAHSWPLFAVTRSG
jgi:class 3 adenylate cyclase